MIVNFSLVIKWKKNKNFFYIFYFTLTNYKIQTKNIAILYEENESFYLQFILK